MKLFSVLLFFLSALELHAQDLPYFGRYFEYRKGDTSYIYEEGALLLSKPSANSKTLASLPLGSSLIIEGEYEVSYEPDFKHPEFYEVKFNGKKGYVQSSFLGIADFKFPELGIDLLFTFDPGTAYGMEKLKYKEVMNATVFYEGEIELSGEIIQLYKGDTRGLDSISSLIYVDYIAEACGMQGGVDIYTWNPMELSLLAQLNEVGDGGVYYITEELIFPADSGGVAKKILFRSEQMEQYDEDSEWYSETTYYRTFNWVAGHMEPAFIKRPEELSTEED